MDINAILKQRDNELNEFSNETEVLGVTYELRFSDGQKIEIMCNGQYECNPPILMFSSASNDLTYKIKDKEFEFYEGDDYDFGGPVKLYCLHGSSKFIYEYDDEGRMFLGKKKYDERFQALGGMIKLENQFIHINGPHSKLQFKYNDETNEFLFLNGTFKVQWDGLKNLV